MILEAIFDFGLWVFEFIFENIPALQPALSSSTSFFAELLSYGIWVIGDDMWLTVLSSISVWLSFKLTWGVVLFIYKLLPLT